MTQVYGRPSTIVEGAVTGYCPGCMHSTISKLVAQNIEEMGLKDKCVGILPVGCGTLSINYWDFDMVAAAHGRAPAVATGLKRCRPDTFVFTYQGDGDLASIGLAEIMHAANRGENIAVVFINNSIYGMTGGQMAPTTLVGQKATTAPEGRKAEEVGYPMHMAEIIASLKAPVFSARCAVDTPANVRKAKEAIKKAFQNELDGKGFSLVEILSNCPTNWGLAPLETMNYIHEHTMKEFPLGVFKDE